MKRKIGFYISLSLVLLFYVAGFVYMSMFNIFYDNDIGVDFVVFTIEHYFTIFIVIVILPVLLGWLIIGLLKSPYWTYEQEEGILALVMFGGLFYIIVIGFHFWNAIERDNYITKKQRDIIVDLIRQEKISKQSIEVGKVTDINDVPLELYVCFEKGFNNPICAKLFENFLIKEKEEVRREKAREYLAEKNKIESIENYNRIVEKVK